MTKNKSVSLTELRDALIIVQKYFKENCYEYVDEETGDLCWYRGCILHSQYMTSICNPGQSICCDVNEALEIIEYELNEV